MFELFSTSQDDAINILKSDHEKVKGLFKKFEDAKSLSEKKKIVAQAVMELKIHAEIEEKIFYAAVRGDISKDIMNEADEEHHVAKLLIAELDQMTGSEDHWEAKFTVLSENIRHHIKEEESDMLPKARHTDIDMNILGRKLLSMKQMLKKNGVPPSLEELAIKGKVAKDDSPARNAKLKLSSAKKPTLKASVKKVTRSAAPASRKPAAKPTAKPAIKKATKASAKPSAKFKAKTAAKAAAPARAKAPAAKSRKA